MAKYNRIEVALKMEEQGMVPLFYHDDIDMAKQVLRACYNGGARLLEFTNRGDFAHEVFGELNKFALKELPGMMMGVGSVTDASAATMYMQLGANFVVTPVLRTDIARVCNRRKVLWSAGCGSLAEICEAEELGCEIVKLFPGSIYGPGFIKAVKGPQPWTNIMPTGGVSLDRDNLKSWIEAGATCVGIGSKLIKKEADGTFDLDKIQASVRKALADISDIRRG